jgi:hypothetical protein
MVQDSPAVPAKAYFELTVEMKILKGQGPIEWEHFGFGLARRAILLLQPFGKLLLLSFFPRLFLLAFLKCLWSAPCHMSLLCEGRFPICPEPGFPGMHVFKFLPAGTAAATAATPTTTAAPSATAARTTPAAAMAGAAGWLRPCLVYVDGPAIQFGSV